MFIHLVLLFTRSTYAVRCDPDDVRACLSDFEVQFLTIDPTDYISRCEMVISQGSVCFDGCPSSALDQFISTYADGVCRKSEAQALENSIDAQVSPVDDLKIHDKGRLAKFVEKVWGQSKAQNPPIVEDKKQNITGAPTEGGWVHSKASKYSSLINSKIHQSAETRGEFSIETVPNPSDGVIPATTHAPHRSATEQAEVAEVSQTLNELKPYSWSDSRLRAIPIGTNQADHLGTPRNASATYETSDSAATKQGLAPNQYHIRSSVGENKQNGNHTAHNTTARESSYQDTSGIWMPSAVVGAIVVLLLAI